MIFGKKKSGYDEKIANVTEVSERGIYVLGSGCKKCNELERNVKLSLKKLGIQEDVFHITDFGVMASMGVMSTPALVIDKTVVSYGKVLSEMECEEILKEARM